MSPIGRAFIVVNLALAGGFVLMAGNYHAHQATYKSELATAKKEFEEQKTLFASQVESLTTSNNEKENQIIALTNTERSQATKIKELDDKIAQKENLLSELSTSIESLESSASAMAAQIKSSTERSNQAYENALTAQKAADDARAELAKAQGELEARAREINGLSDTGESQSAKIAKLERDIRDKDSLLALAAAKVPGIFGVIGTPPMDGTVTEATDNLVTIKVANNSTDADGEKFRGGLVAIYDASGYKGDVSVTSASTSGDSLYLFGRMFVSKPGTSVRAGDRATTNTQ